LTWGTLAAGICTASRPAIVSRLVLFGPVPRREPISRTTGTEAKEPSFVYVTIEDQRNRFLGYVPRGNAPVLEERHFADWAQTYLDSDPESRTRVPASVRIPNGPTVDIDRAWAGQFAYDPAQVVCPTLIIRGEWDSVTRNADARWLSWSDPGTRPGLDDVLTNISVYWFTNTAASSVRLYFESARTPLVFDRRTRVTIPTGILRCPFEAPFPPRSWIERGYQVTHWTDAARDGHFAALEVPDAFVDDVCRFFGATHHRAV
jgi:pimeloyl-ACP methyl ester carboxylesterase